MIGSWVTPPTTGAIEIERGGDENTTINHGLLAGGSRATDGATIARGGTTTARGSRATGSTTTATGGTTTARGSRASGGTTMATGGTTHDNGRHDDGKGQQGDKRQDDSDWRHDDGRHDNGKGQKEAAVSPPPAYQPQHHRENVYKSRLGLI